MIVVARHGNTFLASDEPQRIGRRIDLALTEEGSEQMTALGHALGRLGWRPDMLLSGPLTRARDSAERMREAWPHLPAPDYPNWLDEIDHGADEGRPEHEVAARHGHGALAFWDRHAVPPQGWQVDRAMRIAAWQRLLAARAADGRSALCVTSNGAARYAPIAAELTEGLERLGLRTGACGAFRYVAGKWTRLWWNKRAEELGVTFRG